MMKRAAPSQKKRKTSTTSENTATVTPPTTTRAQTCPSVTTLVSGSTSLSRASTVALAASPRPVSPSYLNQIAIDEDIARLDAEELDSNLPLPPRAQDREVHMADNEHEMAGMVDALTRCEEEAEDALACLQAEQERRSGVLLCGSETKTLTQNNPRSIPQRYKWSLNYCATYTPNSEFSTLSLSWRWVPMLPTQATGRDFTFRATLNSSVVYACLDSSASMRHVTGSCDVAQHNRLVLIVSKMKLGILGMIHTNSESIGLLYQERVQTSIVQLISSLRTLADSTTSYWHSRGLTCATAEACANWRCSTQAWLGGGGLPIASGSQESPDEASLSQ